MPQLKFDSERFKNLGFDEGVRLIKISQKYHIKSSKNYMKKKKKLIVHIFRRRTLGKILRGSSPGRLQLYRKM